MFKFDINWWFRALARFCDYCLLYLFLGAITLFLPFFYGPLFYYFLALCVPLVWAPIEAFLISRWAATPGKILFGLTVRHVKGAKLSYKAALKKAFFLPGRPGVVQHGKMSFKRKLFAFAASAAFMLAAIYGNVFALWSVGLSRGIPVERWVQYSSSDVGFKVSFPTDPEHASKELVVPDSGKVLSYKEITSDENEKIFYSLSHLKLPGTWRLAGTTTLLKGVLDVMVKHTNAELIEKEFKASGGQRVLDFRMKQGEEEVKGRLIKVKGTLYKLTITYPSSHSAKMQGNPFLDSFEVN
jgi:hypothetical protein